jgi:hypothetical protein
LLDTKEKLLDIRGKLDGCLLVRDSAISTLLAARGIEQPYNGANLTRTRTVQSVTEVAQKMRTEFAITVEMAQSLPVEAKPPIRGAYPMPPASSMPHLAGDVTEPIV